MNCQGQLYLLYLRVTASLLLCFSTYSGRAMAGTASPNDVTFSKIRMMVPEGRRARERQVDLVFSDNRYMLVRRGTLELASVAFDSIDKIDYEYAKRHRVTEGAMVMVASLGAGAIVMLTKSTSHWLSVDFHKDGQRKQLVLRLDKGDYRAVIAAAEQKTQKKVNVLSAAQGSANLTRHSRDVDRLVNYSPGKVEAAIREAMEARTCRILKQTPGFFECERPADGERYMGEKVVAIFVAEGDGTRVKVETRKGVMGRAVKKNWSTPIFEEMLRLLQGA